MKITKIILLALIPLMFSSCASVSYQPVILNPVQITRNAPIDEYRYFYITPNEAKTSSMGGIYGNNKGVYGSSVSKSTNPSDIISGYFIKKGLVRLAEIKKDIEGQTMIINYGETGRRNTSTGYTIEVTLQFVSAKTNNVICVVTGEGQGQTEADDIRIAINRCLEEMYKQ